MKTRIASLILLLQVVAVAAFAQNYNIDLSKSTLNWRAEKITGFHEGTISLKAGSFKVESGTLTSGSFAIDMNTIKVTDIEDAETNGKLVGHLKSEDFFDVAKSPEATFTITKPVDLSKSVADVTGILTIKGISKPLTFKTVIIKVGNAYTFNANSIVVDRTKYNVRYGSGSFFEGLGDKVIYDEFVIKLKLVAGQ